MSVPIAQQRTTPVIADQHADSAQLHQRADVDYAKAQAARQQDSTLDQPPTGRR
ncbi:hypothetical protein HRW18_05525 [Streptomyces lunaelactis]|uniref:hypothetical protein n=1 Tax=Streptomyces lunaelactis TaxID=1535768 RepID=UPI001584D62A|nr:hypothetical protein [Streptomyces lunaelactis]NUK07483.1 hypothetical protein [Streptomyces lunaelactis]